MKSLTLVSFLLFAWTFSFSQVFDVDTIQYKGDINTHINLVILGDGYLSSELGQFAIDAKSFSDVFLAESPFVEYRNYFNVFLIKVPSNESGATHPGTATDVTEPVFPVKTVDNYFGSTFDFFAIHRLLVSTNSSAISSVLASNFPSYDQVMILVNSPYYGGSGGAFPSASLEASANDIAIHELGHSIVGLNDEYYAGDAFASEGINMSKETSPTLVRWKDWYGDSGIGIYQHCCGGNSAQWYRPHQDCQMRYLGKSFCAVCVEGTVEKIHSLASPIDSYTPGSSIVTPPSFPVLFELALIKPIPNTLNVKWNLNGTDIGGNTDSVSIDQGDLNLGSNSLTASVEDTTSFLRVANHQSVHLYTVTWTIENNVTSIGFLHGTKNQYSLELYPNPTEDYLNLTFTSETRTDKRIVISTLNGNQVTTILPRGDDPVTLDISRYNPGIYLVEFFANDVLLSTKKIIKN